MLVKIPCSLLGFFVSFASKAKEKGILLFRKYPHFFTTALASETVNV